MPVFAIAVYETVVRALAAYRRARDEFRTARIIDELPYHLRRDIGCPHGYSPGMREETRRPEEPVRVLALAPSERSRPKRDGRDRRDSARPEQKPARKRVGGIAIS